MGEGDNSHYIYIYILYTHLRGDFVETTGVRLTSGILTPSSSGAVASPFGVGLNLRDNEKRLDQAAGHVTRGLSSGWMARP